MVDTPPVQLLDGIDAFSGGATSQPVYAVVRNGLLDLIETHFEDGQRFWPEEVMSKHLNISRATLRRALDDLSRGGSLSRFRAKGTFVRKVASRSAIVRTVAAPQAAPLPFKSLGIFVANFDSQFTADVLDDFSAVAAERGVPLNVYRTHKSDSGDMALAQLTEEPTDQAVILFAVEPSLTRELYIELEARGYRAVTVDVVLPDYPSPYVGTNNDMGMRLGLRHLIDVGHRRIAFLMSEPEDVVVVQSRLTAFNAVSREQAIPEMRVVNAHVKLWEDPIAAAYGAMDDLWNGADPKPTAIMCASDAGAGAVLRWLAERKVNVPGDVSVMGFDDDRTSRYLNPPLTTIAHPRKLIARRALEILAVGSHSHEFLPPSLVVRKSTAEVN